MRLTGNFCSKHSYQCCFSVFLFNFMRKMLHDNTLTHHYSPVDACSCLFGEIAICKLFWVKKVIMRGMVGHSLFPLFWYIILIWYWWTYTKTYLLYTIESSSQFHNLSTSSLSHTTDNPPQNWKLSSWDSPSWWQKHINFRLPSAFKYSPPSPTAQIFPGSIGFLG